MVLCMLKHPLYGDVHVLDRVCTIDFHADTKEGQI